MIKSQARAFPTAGAGVGAGIALRPAPEPLTAEEAEAAAKAAKEEIAPEDMPEYVKLNPIRRACG